MSAKSAIGAMAVAALFLSACAEKAHDPAGVQATLEAFYGAMKKADTATAMAQIAEGAVFLESGRYETRAQYEANHLPADIEFEQQVTGKRGAWDIKINGDTAWAIATTEFEGEFNGRPVNFVSQQLAVLTHQADKWMIRSIHWSSLPR